MIERILKLAKLFYKMAVYRASIENARGEVMVNGVPVRYVINYFQKTPSYYGGGIHFYVGSQAFSIVLCLDDYTVSRVGSFERQFVIPNEIFALFHEAPILKNMDRGGIEDLPETIIANAIAKIAKEENRDAESDGTAITLDYVREHFDQYIIEDPGTIMDGPGFKVFGPSGKTCEDCGQFWDSDSYNTNNPDFECPKCKWERENLAPMFSTRSRKPD